MAANVRGASGRIRIIGGQLRNSRLDVPDLPGRERLVAQHQQDLPPHRIGDRAGYLVHARKRNQ